MLLSQTRRLKPAVLQADLRAKHALEAIPDYQSNNPALSKEGIADLLADMQSAQQAETQAQAALDTARDATVAAEWRFHEAIMGVKAQVIAQYGRSSDQLQALGLKKQTERKRPARRPIPTTP